MSQAESARRELAIREARYDIFAKVTGLFPSRANVFPSVYIPDGFDHSRVWHAGKGLGRIVTTEPYNDTKRAERWCAEAGWRCVAAPAGLSLWNPPRTRLLIAAPHNRGGDPDEILQKFQAAIGGKWKSILCPVGGNLE